MGGRGLDSCGYKYVYSLTETRREGIDWTVPSLDRIQWRYSVSAVKKLDFPLK